MTNRFEFDDTFREYGSVLKSIKYAIERRDFEKALELNNLAYQIVFDHHFHKKSNKSVINDEFKRLKLQGFRLVNRLSLGRKEG